MVANPFLSFISFIQNDQRIAHITREITTVTAEIARVRQSVADRQAQHKALAGNLQALRAEIKDKEFEDKRLQERDRTLRVQLENTGSTKEYIAIEHALADCVAQRKKIEELVFDLWNKRDAREVSCAEDAKISEAYSLEMQELINKNVQLLATLEAEHSALLAGRSELQASSPVEFVEKYESMRKSVDNPVVSVINGTCSGCSVQLQNSDIMQLKRHVLVPCKECYRLLYLV